jgi:hypothetical protein
MGLASREWTSSLSALVAVALLAHLLLCCWGEYSLRNNVCTQAKITTPSHRPASLLMMMKNMVDGGCQCRSEDDDGGDWPWCD